MIRVLMLPTLSSFDTEESGIKRVVEAYRKYSSKFGVEYVECKVEDESRYDVLAVHAGTTNRYPKSKPIVSHCHGLYWVADYDASPWEWKANSNVIESLRMSTEITVPSRWVAESITRDMRIVPHVIGHGIEAGEWEHNYAPEGYVLWNKNRNADVCDPHAIGILAERFPGNTFVTTFSPGIYKNVKEVGLLPHSKMKEVIQKAGIYLSTTKETFGIGALEALASGVPVLGFAHGGNLETVDHQVNGYLATPNSYEDLIDGLRYCLKYRDILSKNAIITSKNFSWEDAVEKVADVYQKAVDKWNDLQRPLELTSEAKPICTIVIPVYNYADRVKDAISSVKEQTITNIECFVVDDGSTDDTKKSVMDAIIGDNRFHYIHQNNGGVATARNNGVFHGTGKYVCCLDADDKIAPEFLEACIRYLEEHREISIAYTGLWYKKPNGEEGLSPWPKDSEYDKQLTGLNQIPTCNVMRREIWERLGGQRQRYAPDGAGEEDAEMWLRAGAYGFRAKKVTDAGLFLYSWLSGRVSGNKQHRMIDYRMWHPWTKDKKHPFASLATPERFSHPVRQYDQPVVSVVIPVGKGHEQVVISALDSLDAQDFRRWEAVVVWDNDADPSFILRTFPHIRFIETPNPKPHGAGYARNRGVDIARAPLLMFLDADDWLVPEAISSMFSVWEQENSIVYSDYVGKAEIDDSLKSKLEKAGRLLDFDEKSRLAVIDYKAFDYDCERAQNQPDVDMYIWNLVTTLMPKLWHDEIGGFDETMKSWEDWDYYIRLARAGKCFVRIPERLVVYRFYSGNRRETGLHEYDELIKYMRSKTRGNTMPCGGCGGRVANVSIKQAFRPNTNAGGYGMVSETRDDEIILCKYTHPNTGQHRVIGLSTRTDYGYHGGGDEFLVHRSDINTQSNMFVVIEIKPPEQKVESPPPVQQQQQELEPPKSIEQEEVEVEKEAPIAIIDYGECPDITPAIQQMFEKMGINSWDKIAELSEIELMSIRGLGRMRAKAIRTFAKTKLEN